MDDAQQVLLDVVAPIEVPHAVNTLAEGRALVEEVQQYLADYADPDLIELSKALAFPLTAVLAIEGRLIAHARRNGLSLHNLVGDTRRPQTERSHVG